MYIYITKICFAVLCPNPISFFRYTPAIKAPQPNYNFLSTRVIARNEAISRQHWEPTMYIYIRYALQYYVPALSPFSEILAGNQGHTTQLQFPFFIVLRPSRISFFRHTAAIKATQPNYNFLFHSRHCEERSNLKTTWGNRPCASILQRYALQYYI